MTVVLPDSDPLKPICELLQRAFPGGPPEPLYLPILKVLSEDMSFRATARAMQVAFGKDPTGALHDVYGVQAPDAVRAADVETVRGELLRLGYPRDM